MRSGGRCGSKPASRSPARLCAEWRVAPPVTGVPGGRSAGSTSSVYWPAFPVDTLGDLTRFSFDSGYQRAL